MHIISCTPAEKSINILLYNQSALQPFCSNNLFYIHVLLVIVLLKQTVIFSSVMFFIYYFFFFFYNLFFFSFQYIQTDYTYLCIYHTCSYISYIFYFNLLIIPINPLQTGIVALCSEILLLLMTVTSVCSLSVVKLIYINCTYNPIFSVNEELTTNKLNYLLCVST